MSRLHDSSPPPRRPDACISIVIPVLSEEAGINRIIAHLRELEAAETAEIIIVDGDPGGGTIRAVLDPDVLTATSAAGRAVQMNRGAAAARGQVLLFLHADTVLPRNALSLITDALRDDRIAAGAFDLGIDSSRAAFRITEQYVALRTRLTRVPFGDQAIFIRRSYFNKLCGFREIPIMEDVDLMKRLRSRRGRICIIPAKVRTSARRWEREGLLSCSFRNWALQIAFALGVHPEKLARWYR